MKVSTLYLGTLKDWPHSVATCNEHGAIDYARLDSLTRLDHVEIFHELSWALFMFTPGRAGDDFE